MAVSCQFIASPTGIQQPRYNPIQPRQSVTEGASSDFGGAPSLTRFCMTEPPCTSQQSIWDECAAQYAWTDGRKGYCACTAGFWEASQQCEDCLIEAGLEPDPSYAIQQKSEGSSICSSYSLEYGNSSSKSTDHVKVQTRTSRDFSASITSSSDPLRLPTGDWLSGMIGISTTPVPLSTPVTTSPMSGANGRLFHLMISLEKLRIMALLTIVVAFFSSI